MSEYEREKSCGCVIIDEGKVLLVQQIEGHWGFPKGHVEENETEKETAIREVKEETNLDVVIEDDKRYVMEYMADKGKMKDVIFFVARKIGGEIKPQEGEVCKLEWLKFDEAMERLTFNNTKEVLSEVLKSRGLYE